MRGLSYVVLTGLLASCSGSGGVDNDAGVGPGGGGETSALAEALCARHMRCNPSSWGTQAECVAYYGSPCIDVSRVEAQDGLDACVAALRDTPCSEGTFGANTACLDALIRTRARRIGGSVQTEEGGECGGSVACTGGRLCSSFGESCGTCIGGAQIGEACDSGSCITGHCDPETRTCAPDKQDGEACTRSYECDSLTCGATDVCEPYAGGEACTTSLECLSQRCRDGICVVAAPLGSACADHADCQTGAACEGGRCQFIARCTLGALGEPCRFSDCQEGLRCENGTCSEPAVPGLPDGAPCTSFTDCASGQCVVSQTPPFVCGRRQSNYLCDADEQCESGACVDFRCAGAASCEP